MPWENGELGHAGLTWMDPRTQTVQHGSSALLSLLSLLQTLHSSSCHTLSAVVASQESTSLTVCRTRISILTQSLICFLSLDKPSLLLGLVFLEEVESIKGLC